MNTTSTLPLGQIAMTSRVAAIKKRNALFSTFVEKSLHRHNYKDWGDANHHDKECNDLALTCLLYTSPSPRDRQKSRMPSSA